MLTAEAFQCGTHSGFKTAFRDKSIRLVGPQGCRGKSRSGSRLSRLRCRGTDSPHFHHGNNVISAPTPPPRKHYINILQKHGAQDLIGMEHLLCEHLTFQTSVIEANSLDGIFNCHKTGGKHEYLKSFPLASKTLKSSYISPSLRSAARDYFFVLDSPPPTFKMLGD